ncbi:MAG: hypothetical protein DMG14_21835 [Acidobacteria bacterium]|nr:MAG: hypothetical protein DMG14_21835 [Acidobacteriota bacterium]
MSASYDRINRNPGYLTISTIRFTASVGITDRLEFGAVLEANRRVLVGRAEQLSFGQQALGLFGNRTPGALPLATERVSGSSRMAQLRFPPAADGILTGAAGYYNLLPFAGLVREGGGIGQVSLALKFRVLSESSGAPIGLAVRSEFDVPIRKGIEYLLLHPTGTADLQFGFDAIGSRNIRDVAGLYWNLGYRHINQPAHVSVVRLADEAPLGFGWNIPRTGRIQFLGETTAEVFFGSHTPNTTFGAEDPIDLTVGFRVGVIPRLSLSAGYRRVLNQFGRDKNGFVVNTAFVSSRK